MKIDNIDLLISY